MTTLPNLHTASVLSLQLQRWNRRGKLTLTGALSKVHWRQHLAWTWNLDDASNAQMVPEIEVIQHVHDVGGILLIPLAKVFENLHLPVRHMCRSIAVQPQSSVGIEIWDFSNERFWRSKMYFSFRSFNMYIPMCNFRMWKRMHKIMENSNDIKWRLNRWTSCCWRTFHSGRATNSWARMRLRKLESERRAAQGRSILVGWTSCTTADACSAGCLQPVKSWPPQAPGGGTASCCGSFSKLHTSASCNRRRAPPFSHTTRHLYSLSVNGAILPRFLPDPEDPHFRSDDDGPLWRWAGAKCEKGVPLLKLVYCATGVHKGAIRPLGHLYKRW